MPMRPELRRRALQLVASLVCAALCAGCGEVHALTTPGPPRPLTVAIGGQPSALYASLYTAAADGDFRLGALAVSITQPPSALGALESGAAGVAVVSEPALLAARAAGAALVAIGALVRQPLDGLVSLSTRPVTGATGLTGATIAVSPTALAGAEMMTVLDADPVGGVHWASTAGSLAAALTSGRAQATLGGPWPLEVAQLALRHHPASVLEVQQAGVPTYTGLAVVVRLREAHYDGPLLRAFLQSLSRGERAVAADPAAAAATLAKVNPRLSAALERAVLHETLPIAAPASASEPFGFQSPAAWQTFGDWMTAHRLLPPTAPNSGDAMDDEFLPGQGE
ncbi:MAG: ABC transporter substrate-binding protein [Solirubrobacteraceae bacterium]|jgi:putative hydroxymethylpyrimidine transport system substrate-binding protein